MIFKLSMKHPLHKQIVLIIIAIKICSDDKNENRIASSNIDLKLIFHEIPEDTKD